MMIPENVMKEFINEGKELEYGKLSITLVRRGSHEHFEIDKHYTFPDEENKPSLEKKDKLNEG